MKRWDAIVIGAGIIGVSLARELRKQGLRVLVVEKGEPGREASWAAGGMLADFPLELPPALRELAAASARMYPEFVQELEDESGLKIDLRDQGTLLFVDAPADRPSDAPPLPAPLWELEPNLRSNHTPSFLRERSVDPRDLITAALAAARHRGVDFSSGDRVLAIEVAEGRVVGVRTNKTRFAAPIVVNCAGAWAGQVGCDTDVATGASQARPERRRRVEAVRSSAGSVSVSTRPVKGQMLCVTMPEKNFLRHVVRTPDVYLIPRSDGRLLIGATQEEAGFDRRIVPATIQKLRQAALDLVPRLADARMLEAWAGLRPGTPDSLPILGTTSAPGYFVATGHFRDGILLAPVTARVINQIITGRAPDLELGDFSLHRFSL